MSLQGAMPHYGSVDAAIAVVESAREAPLRMNAACVILVHRRLVVDRSPGEGLSMLILSLMKRYTYLNRRMCGSGSCTS